MQSEKLAQLQKEISDLLERKLEHVDITPEHAAQIANYILDTLTDTLTDEQIDQIIPHLDDQFIELSEIVYNHLAEFEKIQKHKVEVEAEELIKKGKLEEATVIMNNYLYNKFLGGLKKGKKDY